MGNHTAGSNRADGGKSAGCRQGTTDPGERCRPSGRESAVDAGSRGSAGRLREDERRGSGAERGAEQQRTKEIVTILKMAPPVEVAPPVEAQPPARRILIASMVGTTIEFFDFYIYAMAAVLVFP